MNTDQFMKEMGVVSTDQLTDKQIQSIYTSKKLGTTKRQQSPDLMNKDLETVETPNLNYIGYSQPNTNNVPGGTRRQNTADVLRNVGGNLNEIGQFLVADSSEKKSPLEGIPIPAGPNSVPSQDVNVF